MAGRALCHQKPFTQSFYLPHPGYTGLVLALKQGWELIEATPLTLQHTIQGGGHLFTTTGKIVGLALLPPGHQAV